MEHHYRILSEQEAKAKFEAAGLSFPFELKAPSKEKIPSQHKSDQEILETLRGVGHRLTTNRLIDAMSERGLNPAESTVKKRLAEMVRDGLLTNDPTVNPRGYGLPEWVDGSHSSSGS
jgi:hypothetical protein